MAVSDLSRLRGYTNGVIALAEDVRLGKSDSLIKVAEFRVSEKVNEVSLWLSRVSDSDVFSADKGTLGFEVNGASVSRKDVSPREVVSVVFDPASLKKGHGDVAPEPQDVSVEFVVQEAFSTPGASAVEKVFKLDFRLLPPEFVVKFDTVALSWEDVVGEVVQPGALDRTDFRKLATLRISDTSRDAFLAPVVKNLRLRAKEDTAPGNSEVPGVVFEETRTPQMDITLPLPPGDQDKTLNVGVLFGDAAGRLPTVERHLPLHVTAELGEGPVVRAEFAGAALHPDQTGPRFRVKLSGVRTEDVIDTYDDVIHRDAPESKAMVTASGVDRDHRAGVFRISIGAIADDSRIAQPVRVTATTSDPRVVGTLSWFGSVPDVADQEGAAFDVFSGESRQGILLADLREIPEGGETFVELLIKLGEQRLLSRQIKVRTERVAKASDTYLAIDLGTSATAAAVRIGGDVGGKPQALDLARLLNVVDAKHAEHGGKFVISSDVGFDARRLWRRTRLGPSIWHQDPETNGAQVRQLPELSVPFVPHSEASELSAEVVTAPKMAVLNAASATEASLAMGRQAGPPPQLSPAEVIAALLDEMGALHLAWDPTFASLRGTNIILSYSNQFLESHLEIYRRAIQGQVLNHDGVGPDPLLSQVVMGLAKRLDTHPGNIFLVPESIAAAAGMLTGHPLPSNTKQNVLVFDLGSGTLDVSLLSVQTDNNGSVIGAPDDLNSVGASVGGDTIDLVLYFIIHNKLAEVARRHPGLYQRRLVDDASDEAHLAAKFNMSGAIRAAKARLSAAIKRRGGRFRWADDIEMIVQVGGPAGAPDRWPTDQSSVMDRTALEDDPDLVFDVPGSEGELHLILRRVDVDVEPMNQLLNFMVHDVIDLALAGVGAAADVDKIVVTGRAALWPLLWELLERPRDGALRSADLLLDTPPDAQEMKFAVARGAILAVMSKWEINRPFKQKRKWAALSLVEDTVEGTTEIDLDAGCTVRARGEIAVVRYPAAFEIADVRHRPWAISLLSHSGVQISHRNALAHGASAHSGVRVSVKDDGTRAPDIFIGSARAATSASPLPHRRSILRPNVNITREDAPSGWEDRS